MSTHEQWMIIFPIKWWANGRNKVGVKHQPVLHWTPRAFHEASVYFSHLGGKHYCLNKESIVIQRMVNWWFGARWFGIPRGSPLTERDDCYWLLESQTTGPQTNKVRVLTNILRFHRTLVGRLIYLIYLIVLPSYMVIVINHYKDPYQPTTIMECQQGFERCSHLKWKEENANTSHNAPES